MSKIAPNPSKSRKATTLKSLLLQIHLQQYLPLFQRNEIDFTTFLTLNEQTLKSVGIGNDSHRKALLSCIKKLQLFLTSTVVIPTEGNNMSLEMVDDNDSMKVSIEEPGLDILTPIAEEEEPGFPEISNDVTEVTRTDDDETISENKSQVSDPNRELNELPTNETRPSSISLHSENDCTPTSRSRKHFSTDNEDLLTLRRQRGADVRDSNWRLSMPVTNSELPRRSSRLPSYYDVVDRQCIKTRVEEVCDELPPYSCSVNKAGYVFKKNELSSKGYRSRDRSWKKQYLYLWGTLLRIYKSEPIDINRATPAHEFSMLNAQIGLATDYSKRSNVIRMRFPSTGHQFLFQIQDRDECVSWIEKLQSSVNISSILDEREMPMFITLPMRRRRVGAVTSSATSSSSSLSSVDYESITIINPSSSTPISASGLTFQQFNDMARELQQVQITEALPQQQLSW